MPRAPAADPVFFRNNFDDLVSVILIRRCRGRIVRGPDTDFIGALAMAEFITPKRRMRPAHLAILACFGAAATSPTMAVTVQRATYGELATVMVGRVPHNRLSHKPTTITNSISKGPGSATSTESVAPMPQPTLSSSGTTTGRGEASGGSSMSYYFQIVGPQPVAVPVIMTVSGMLSGTSKKISSGAKAEIITNLGSFVYPIDTSCPGSCGGYNVPKTENISAWTKQQPAGPNVVELYVSSDVSKPGSASATLSLTLEIDPTFPHASKYHIILSKGVGNP
jgi:hypothetical protein